jgi:hypothetical protein
MTARVDADELAAEWLAKSARSVGVRHCRLDDAARNDPELESFVIYLKIPG